MKQKSKFLLQLASCQSYLVNALSSRARYWLPTVDYPTVRTTLTWDITAPQKYTSLANGKLVSDETKDGYTTTRWQLDYPW